MFNLITIENWAKCQGSGTEGLYFKLSEDLGLKIGKYGSNQKEFETHKQMWEILGNHTPQPHSLVKVRENSTDSVVIGFLMDHAGDDLNVLVNEGKLNESLKYAIESLVITEVNKFGIRAPDIHPGNIVVDSKGVIRVIDWGYNPYFDPDLVSEFKNPEVWNITYHDPDFFKRQRKKEKVA